MAVDSVRKNFNTICMTDYVPQYSETSSVGKRQLLLPDEVLRFPLDQALLFIRGQRVMRVKKMDYTLHPDAKYLQIEKTEAYVPEWRKQEAEDTVVFEQDTINEGSLEENVEQLSLFDESLIFQEPLGVDTEIKKKSREKRTDRSVKPERDGKKVMKVEDLFATNGKENRSAET